MTHPSKRYNLNPIEVNALVDWVLYHMTASDRRALAAHLPGVYAKVCDVRVTVTHDTSDVDAPRITLEHK